MNNTLIDAAKRIFNALYAMQILRIFGVVVAVHAGAFLMIMASPGCSTKSRQGSQVAANQAPAAEASVAPSNPFMAAPAPQAAAAESSPTINFDPNAVAGGNRLSPTRPNTAESSALVHEATSPAPAAPEKTIKVGKGDSLWTIAKKHGVPVTELAEANKLKTGATLRVGQTIIVPSKNGSTAKSSSTPAAPKPAAKQTATAPAAESAPKASSANLPAGSIRHTVKPGESLGSIARKYGVKAGDIGVINNISDPKNLRAGKEIIIPGAAKLPKSNSAAGTSETSASAAAKPESASAPAAVEAPAANSAPVFQFGEASPTSTPSPAPGSNSVPVIKIEEDGSGK